LINDKANKLVNQFGSGRSEISIHNIKSENPTQRVGLEQSGPHHHLIEN
jgi:hypothetical protein